MGKFRYVTLLGLLFILSVGIYAVSQSRGLNLAVVGTSMTASHHPGTEVHTSAPTTTNSPEGKTDLTCGGDGASGVCNSDYVTRYVLQSGSVPIESFCKISPDTIESLCGSNPTGCKTKVDSFVAQLTAARGAKVSEGVSTSGKQCSNGYRGALSCYKESFNAGQSSAVLAAISGEWICCRRGDPQCKLAIDSASTAAIEKANLEDRLREENQGVPQNGVLNNFGVPVSTRQPTAAEQLNLDAYKARFGAENVHFDNGEVVVRLESRTLSKQLVSVETTRYSASESPLGFTPVPADGSVNRTTFQNPGDSGKVVQINLQETLNDNTPSVINSSAQPSIPAGPGPAGPSPTGAGVRNPTGSLALGNNTATNNGIGSTLGNLGNNATPQGTPQATPRSPYRSLRTPQSLQQRPQSFVQRFTGGNSAIGRLANFVTGQAALRTTPEGEIGGQPQVIYVTPDYAGLPRINSSLRSIQAIASDIAAQTPPKLARVDHFAQTLTAVGGPNAINTENKSFGRIQDLIVEDEAIRALRVAEEKGKQAKNAVFCRVNETSQNCTVRREAKAEEVERRVFVAELEKRVLPDTAIQHFLAVYDGWIRPQAAPATRATSTLAVLNAQGNDPLAEYEVTTGGNNFVLWVMENVADAAFQAVTSLTNLLTGGSSNASDVTFEEPTS
ncbi:MAG: hypothetical protein JKX80_00150 [Candidatus Pacebacteria bacterium]|nr:hypothetical protein [Candidatus Paceibacterota bacterium]